MQAESLTQAQIDLLIACPKQADGARARDRQEARHLQRDYRLQSEDGEHSFIAFTRQNVRLTDDFSAGLRWLSPSGVEVILVRCNGSSHAHNNAIEGDRFVGVCHVHRATERYVSVDRTIDTWAQPDESYRTLAGALHRLTNIANIRGIDTEPEHSDLFKP